MKTRTRLTRLETKSRAVICSLAISASLATPAWATFIDFNNGTATQAIGTFYLGQGLSFANASWQGPVSNQSGTPSTGLFLADLGDNGFNPPYSPTATTPIVGIFSAPQSTVSILAVDVGSAGATLAAYDAASGGTLVGTDTFIGSGSGVGAYQTLTITAPSIMRFELYQPLPNSEDGVFFDNLTFTPVPEPGTLCLCVIGVLLMTARSKIAFLTS